MLIIRFYHLIHVDYEMLLPNVADFAWYYIIRKPQNAPPNVRLKL
jgi:hypothetical protein